MNDLQKYHVELLAMLGGFSDRYIASIVFHKKMERVVKSDIRCVQYHRLRRRVLLGDWRNGRTPEARSYANGVVRAKKRRRAG